MTKALEVQIPRKFRGGHRLLGTLIQPVYVMSLTIKTMDQVLVMITCWIVQIQIFD